MEQEIILKKNIIGGFDRKQVTQCLLTLKSECNKHLSSEEIEDFKKNIELLTDILNDKANQIQLLNEQVENLNKYKPEERYTVSMSISEAEKNIERAKAEAETIKQDTKNKLKNKSAQAEKILLKIQAINEEAEKIKLRLVQTLEKLSEIQLDTEVSENLTERQQIKAVEEVTTVQTEEKASEIVTENAIEGFEAELNLKSDDSENNINSIDNFFEELYKMTNGKLFEPHPLAKSDSDDDFEYEY